MKDKRISGGGAVKGWATRRMRAVTRQTNHRLALNQLVDVADAITGDLVVGERALSPGKYVVGALTLLKWRNGILSAVRLLDAKTTNAAVRSQPSKRSAMT